MFIVELIYSFLLVLFIVPVLVITIQIIIAALPSEQKNNQLRECDDRNVCVLIPAHNESTNIIPTLNSVCKQSGQKLSVLVVADNCDDDTAQIARQYDVEVIERHDLTRRGKGYALDFGIKHLQRHPPDLVIIIDADCTVEDEAIKHLVETAWHSGRPAQANYLMLNVEVSSIKMKIAEFAWLLKNFVRPLGFSRLNLPCQLTGSGMAFTWQLLSKMNFATSHIVEDMKLGLEAATLGAAPIFCREAMVYSYFPMSDEGIKAQRTRWEHGHLGVILKDVPQILLKSVIKKDLNLLAMGLDLLVPPLSLMALSLFILLGSGLLLTAIFGLSKVLTLVVACMVVLFALSIMVFWITYGQKVIALSELLTIPYYILIKMPIYVKFIFERQSDWIRSQRDKK